MSKEMLSWHSPWIFWPKSANFLANQLRDSELFIELFTCCRNFCLFFADPFYKGISRNGQHKRGMFRPFHAFFSRSLCPNAKNQSKFKILLSFWREISLRWRLPISLLVTSNIFYLDARDVDRFWGCVVIFILVAVYMRAPYVLSNMSMGLVDIYFK